MLPAQAAQLAGAATKLTQAGTPLFVVQADRALDVPSTASAAQQCDAALWAAEKMDEDDKRLCATRLLGMIEEYAPGDSAKQASVARAAAKHLPELYETLKPMEVVIASPLLAQLAANLAPSWGAAAQRTALREGLGVAAPRDKFWKPLGNVTANLSIDDKLWLLLDVLPHYLSCGDDADAVPPALAGLLRASGDAGWDASGVLPRAIAIVQEKVPDLVEPRETQLVATDLACRERVRRAELFADGVAATPRRRGYFSWPNRGDAV